MGNFVGWGLFILGTILLFLDILADDYSNLLGFIIQILGLAYVIEYKVSKILDEINKWTINQKQNK
jgi:hypothetical protein